MEIKQNTVILGKTRLASSLVKEGWDFSSSNDDTMIARLNNILVRFGDEKLYVYKVIDEDMILVDSFPYGKRQLSFIKRIVKKYPGGSDDVPSQIPRGITQRE